MDADAELLCTLMPSFWWFRESHYIAGDKLRIHATVVARGDCGPDNVTCYINGSEVTPVRKTSSAYADRSFCSFRKKIASALPFASKYSRQPIQSSTELVGNSNIRTSYRYCLRCIRRVQQTIVLSLITSSCNSRVRKDSRSFAEPFCNSSLGGPGEEV